MFKSGRWWSDKNRVKSVFKLQFHVTQVPELNSEALAVSVVPGDVGKQTARLEKGIVREGTCRWEHPIHETVKFARDAKTGKIGQRTYRFLVVSSGSGKSGYVGEVSIDFSDYALATKGSTVSLPLKNSKCNGFLHVSIQRLQENVEHGELGDTEHANGKFTESIVNALTINGEPDNGTDSHLNVDGPHLGITQTTELIRRASSGSDMTMSSSGSSSGLNTPREAGLRNNNILQEPTGLLSFHNLASVPPKQTENTSAANNGECHQSKWGWLVDSDRGTNTDDSSQSTLTGERPEETSDIEVEKLKADMVVLSRQTDLSELELHTLRKQIVKESKKVQDLLKELTCTKEERDALRAECEKYRSFQARMEEAKRKNKFQFESGDTWAILEELRQELRYEKDVNVDLRMQLQKTNESNGDLILAIKELEEMLESKDREAPSSQKSQCNANAISRNESDDDEDQKALDELVREHRDAKETYVLEQTIMDLRSEIEMYRRGKDEIEMQMEQLALDYEILKQESHGMSIELEQSRLQEQLKMQYECCSSFVNVNELEAKIESLELELKKQSEASSESLAIIDELQAHIKELEEEMGNRGTGFVKVNELEAKIESLEHELKKQSEASSESLATIDKLQAHIKELEEEMGNQGEGFQADLEALTQEKVAQEQRAIRAEDALQKTRWKNVSTAEKLQEELKRLCVQMVSTFDENEKVAMNALAEASGLRMQNSRFEDMLKKSEEKLCSVKDSYEAKLLELSEQLNLKEDHIRKMLVETDDKSRQLEYMKIQEEQLVGALSEQIHKLKAELDRLIVENKVLSERAEQEEDIRDEMEFLKESLKQSEATIEKSNAYRDELLSTIALLKKEAMKSIDELSQMKSSKSQDDSAMDALRFDVEALKSQCDKLKASLFENEAEKERLVKQVFQLKGDLKKKDDAYTSIEKKLKESSKRTVLSDGLKSPLKNQKSLPVPHGSKELSNLREKLKSLEAQIKSKEAALEASANSFSAKEIDLRNTIAELESRMEELNRNSAQFSSHPNDQNTDETDPENSGRSEMRGIDIPSISILLPPHEIQNSGGTNSNANAQEEELETSSVNNGFSHVSSKSKELESLRERNKAMERELKEMQERYSEVSLKFAEVEGERQQLVMSLRNLKISKKS